jgi:hypothetical protein
MDYTNRVALGGTISLVYAPSGRLVAPEGVNIEYRDGWLAEDDRVMVHTKGLILQQAGRNVSMTAIPCLGAYLSSHGGGKEC